MRYGRILDNFSVGSCPLSEADVRYLREQGVSAVMNLQTDADLRDWNIDWERMGKLYRGHNIRTYRYPIRDVDVDDLRRKLCGGLELLDRLTERGAVYLHCSAGMSRSPTVAVAFLMKRMNMNLNDAADFFRERYRFQIHLETLKGWSDDGSSADVSIR